MIEPAKEIAVASATALLTHYSFDLGGYTAEQLIDQWLSKYQAIWLRLAVIEALYQGRYKAVSVAQILAFWGRRGQPIFHFNHEFERLVCRKFPNNLAPQSNFYSENASAPVASSSPANFPKETAQHSSFAVSEDDAQIEAAPALTPSEPSTQQNAHARESAFPQNPVVGDAEAILEFTNNAALTEPRYYQAEQPKSVSPDPSATAPAAGEKTAEQLVEATWPVKFKQLATEIVEPEEIPEEEEPALLDEVEDEPVTAPNPTQDRLNSDSAPQKLPQVKYQADWSRYDASKNPIGRFTPSPEPSDFYTKLKAVAESPEEVSADVSAGKPPLRDIEVEKDLWTDD